jgi:hypothetical protein
VEWLVGLEAPVFGQIVDLNLLVRAMQLSSLTIYITIYIAS